MDAQEQALMCVLMLRGPQTPGELKQRTERMYVFADPSDVREALIKLIERELVMGLGRRPGQKGSASCSCWKRAQRRTPPSRTPRGARPRAARPRWSYP